MSMHFAPQWVKPIKPTGPAAAAATATADVPPPSSRGLSSSTSHPFPALNPGRSSSPSLTTPTNPVLSYSKITTASSPLSPSFPAENGYFPHAARGDAHPFRYGRDEILALWDEERVKEVPIELAELLEHAGVLVSKDAVKPVGMRDINDVEKKLLASSVHPSNPVRQRMAPNDRNDRQERGDRGDREQINGHTPRRPAGTQATGKDNTAPSSGRAAFGGFGRGEGGAFGGGKIGSIGSGPPSGLETRGPGGIGGGFGGVSKRLSTRRTESSDLGGDATSTSIRGSAPWRAARPASGTFEGVLGFGQGGAAPLSSSTSEVPPSGTSTGWRERQERERQERDISEEKEEPSFGNGGGPGWGNGQRKWRLAAGAEQEKTLNIPIAMETTESVAATASATPIPERDATMREIPLPQAPTPSVPPPQQSEAPEREDLGSVQWYYKDPNGQEQGPFAATEMHDWYSHAYFTDDLPLRRSHETGFHTLAELKAATGNGVQPFLAPVRPRLPPNLPIPAAVMPPISPAIVNGTGHPVDAFRNLAIHPGQQQPYNQYMPGPDTFSPAPFGQFGQPIHNAAFASPAAASPWGAPQPQRMDNFAGRPPFQDQRIGGPQPYSPAPGAPLYPHAAFGAPGPSPWGAPGPVPVYLPGQEQVFNQAGFQPSPQTQQTQPQASFPDHQTVEPAEKPQPIELDQNASIETPIAAQTSPDEASYFPPVDADAISGAADAAAEVAEDAHTDEAAVEDVADEEVDVQPSPEPSAATEDVVIKAAAVPAAPASVWGQVTPTPRKQSISSAPISQPVAASKTAAIPASLPAKPVAAVSEVAAAKIAQTAPVAQSPLDKPSSGKSAPWAAKEEKPAASTGPSLRDIQLAEAKAAEARRLAQSEARLAAAAPLSTPDGEVLTNMSWGLPSSGSGKTSAALASPSVATAPAPAWGSGEAGPKKTLKQIQEEEERRKKAAQAKAAAAAGAGSPTVNGAGMPKRGYADLAANAPSVSPPVGWSTVGSGGKVVPGAAPKTASTASAAAATPTKSLASVTGASTTPSRLAVSTPPPSSAGAARKANGTSSSSTDDHSPPSVDFLKWTKTALVGLKIPVDDFIQMLLTFPVDPPASSRADVLEIISDSVYANSSTLDGRRFAQEFYEKRKADAKRDGGLRGKIQSSSAAAGGAGGNSLADVVRSVPAKKEDLGFKVVKAKGKKKN